MSYDISYKVQCLENPNLWVSVGEPKANTTWNLREMITTSTGLEWNNEEDNGLVKDIIPYIIHGLGELETNPEKYKKYEAQNGWGTLEGCKNFFIQCLRDWSYFQDDYSTRDFKDIVHFWIV